MTRHWPAALLVIGGFLLGREAAVGEPEVTKIGRVEAEQITLRAGGRAVVISPQGIWLETDDGRAAYVEADKFALAALAGGQRRNLAALVGSPGAGAGLVLYADGAAPQMIVQTTPAGAGLSVSNPDGSPRLGLVGGPRGARMQVFDARGRVIGHVGTAPPGAKVDGAEVESGAYVALFDAEGKVVGRLPAAK